MKYTARTRLESSRSNADSVVPPEGDVPAVVHDYLMTSPNQDRELLCDELVAMLLAMAASVEDARHKPPERTRTKLDYRINFFRLSPDISMTTDGWVASKREVPNWEQAAIELKKQALDTPQAVRLIDNAVRVVGDEDKKDEIESRLSNFLLAVYKAWLDEENFVAEEAHIRSIVGHFVDSLLTESTYYVSQFYLRSLFVEEPVILNDGCLLRQFTAEDMLSLLENGYQEKVMEFQMIGTVLEVRGTFHHSSEAQKIAEETLFYLSLFVPVQPQIMVTHTFCADISNSDNNRIERHRREDWYQETWIIDQKQKGSFETFFAAAEKAGVDDSLYWREKDKIDPLSP